MVIITNNVTGKVFITSSTTENLSRFYPVFEFDPKIYTNSDEVKDKFSGTRVGRFVIKLSEDGTYSSTFDGIITNTTLAVIDENKIEFCFYDEVGTSAIVKLCETTSIDSSRIDFLDHQCTEFSKRFGKSPDGLAFVGDCTVEMYDGNMEDFKCGVFSKNLLPIIAEPSGPSTYKFLECPNTIKALAKQLRLYKKIITSKDVTIPDDYCLHFTSSVTSACKLLKQQFSNGAFNINNEGAFEFAKIAPTPESNYLESNAEAVVLLNCMNGIPTWTARNANGEEETVEIEPKSFIFFSSDGFALGGLPGFTEFINGGNAPWMIAKNNPVATLGSDLSSYFHMLQKNAALILEQTRLGYLSALRDEIDINCTVDENVLVAQNQNQKLAMQTSNPKENVLTVKEAFGDKTDFAQNGGKRHIDAQHYQNLGESINNPFTCDTASDNNFGPFGQYTFSGVKDEITKSISPGFRYSSAASYSTCVNKLKEMIQGDIQSAATDVGSTGASSKCLGLFDDAFEIALASKVSCTVKNTKTDEAAIVKTTFSLSEFCEIWRSSDAPVNSTCVRIGDLEYVFSFDQQHLTSSFKGNLARCYVINRKAGVAKETFAKAIHDLVADDKIKLQNFAFNLLEGMMHSTGSCFDADILSGDCDFSNTKGVPSTFVDSYTKLGPSDCVVRRGRGTGDGFHLLSGGLYDFSYRDGAVKEVSDTSTAFRLKGLNLRGLGGNKPIIEMTLDLRPVATLSETGNPYSVVQQIKAELMCLLKGSGYRADILFNGYGNLVPPTVSWHARDNAWDASNSGYSCSIPLGFEKTCHPDGPGEGSWFGGSQFTANWCPSFEFTVRLNFTRQINETQLSNVILKGKVPAVASYGEQGIDGATGLPRISTVMFFHKMASNANISDLFSAYIVERISQVFGNARTNIAKYAFAGRDSAGRLIDVASLIYFTNLGESSNDAVLGLVNELKGDTQSVIFFACFKRAYEMVVNDLEMFGSVSAEALAQLHLLADAADMVMSKVAKPDFKPFYMTEERIKNFQASVQNNNSVAYYMQYVI